MFMSELTIQFGQLVRKYRKEKNMSQEQLALLCNIDRSYLGRIERGEVNPTLEKIYECPSYWLKGLELHEQERIANKEYEQRLVARKEAESVLQTVSDADES